MNPIILKQNVKKWNESLCFLKSKQSELSVEEWTAIECLADLWRTREKLDEDDKSDCTGNIEILVNSDVKHGNNRDIIKYSKEFRGVAKLIYLAGDQDYAEYRKAFQEFVNLNSNRTVRTRQTPSRTTEPEQPRRESSRVEETFVPRVETVDFPTGEKYIGTLDSMGNFNGKGKLMYPNGNWSEGEWIHGEMTGKGKEYYAESKRLDIGEYKNGNRVGTGRMEWSNGDWAEGQWNNSGLHGKAKRYYSEYKRLDEGDFVDGNRDGHGVMKWDGGDSYVGIWKDTDNGLCGFGTYYNNGTGTKGEWRNGTWYPNGTTPPPNNTRTQTPPPTTDDKGDAPTHTGLGCLAIVLAAFFPVIAVIIYFFLRKSYKNYADLVLGGAIFGFIGMGIMAMCS